MLIKLIIQGFYYVTKLLMNIDGINKKYIYQIISKVLNKQSLCKLFLKA